MTYNEIQACNQCLDGFDLFGALSIRSGGVEKSCVSD